jgi:putative transposase
MSLNQFQFAPGARIKWQGIVYEVRRVTGGKVNLEELSTEAFVTVELCTITEALFSGQLEFITPTSHTLNAPSDPPGASTPSQKRAGRSLEDYPPEGVAIARRRLWVIQPLLEGERDFGAVLQRICQVRDEMKVEAAEEFKERYLEDVDVSDTHSRSTKATCNTAGTLGTLATQGTTCNKDEVDRTEDTLEGRQRRMAMHWYVKGAAERKLQSSLSLTTVYRWINAYQKAGGDLRALIPSTHKRGGPGKPRLPSQVNNIVEATIKEKYVRREKATVDAVVNEVAIRIEEANAYLRPGEKLSMPSRRTIARRVSAFSTGESAALYAVKHGKVAAKREYSQYGQTTYPAMPLERVEIDHTKTDLMVVDDKDNLPLGRLTLTYALDVATRYPLGCYLGFEPPSYYSVMECLYHAISPKTSIRERYGTEHDWLAYGVPQTLVVDNGREFVGRDLKDACEQHGIELLYLPVRTPHFKAGVERQLGSLNTMLWHQLPGTTFSNPSKRGDYNSAKQACITLNDIDLIWHKFLLDYYAERFHAGLGGVPARRLEAAFEQGFIPRLPRSLDDLKITLGRVDFRVVHHYGIEFEGLRYNSPDIALLRTRLRGQKVKIKYHPGDLSRLWVYDPFEEMYLELPALDGEYTDGLSLWKHRVIKRFALEHEEKADMVALGRARRAIQSIVDRSRNHSRGYKRAGNGGNRGKSGTGTRSKAARWETGGKPIGQLSAGADRSPQRAGGDAAELPRDGTAPQRLPSGADTGESLDGIAVEETVNADGWELEYEALPKSKRDLPKG